MNIKYIKDAPNGKAGTTDIVTDFEGNILIATGLAEPHEPKPKRKTKPKKDDATLTDEGTKTDTKTDTDDE